MNFTIEQMLRNYQSKTENNTKMAFHIHPSFIFSGITDPRFWTKVLDSHGENYSFLVKTGQPGFKKHEIFSPLGDRAQPLQGFNKGSEKKVKPPEKKFDQKTCGKAQVAAIEINPKVIAIGMLETNGKELFDREVERLIGKKLAEILINKNLDFFLSILGSLQIGRSYLYEGKLVTGIHLSKFVNDFLLSTDGETKAKLSDSESELSEQVHTLFEKFERDAYFLS